MREAISINGGFKYGKNPYYPGMERCEKKLGVIRDSTPAERRENIAMLLLGGIYSLAMWAAVLLPLWRLWR